MRQSEPDEDPFKFPKRSLSIAFVAGSILFLLLTASVAFSAMRLQVSIGEPSYTIDGQNYTLSVPINISNNGLFDLQNFQVNTTVFDGETELFNSSALVPNIAHESESKLTHNLTVNLPDFLRNHQKFLFNDAKLQAAKRFHLVFARLLPVGLDFNDTFDWRAPLSGFNASDLEFESVNLTTELVSFNVSFNNHALFPVAGNVNVSVFDGTERVAGESLQLSVHSEDSYGSTIQLWIPTTVHVTRVTITIRTDFFSWEGQVYG
jgi:hypothetical protein